RLFTGKKLNEEEQDKAFSKIDLNNLVEEGEVLGKDQEEIHEIKLFRNALDFSEVKIRECIVPRPDLIAISIESSLEELTNLFVSTGKSRILIYKETIDNIIGYVHSSSLFQNPTSITQAISKVIIVPETMSALNLLNTFTKEQRSMAVVVNEFGITAGIVTLEDVMEEIFGEIEDEHDLENPTEITVSENEYIFSGRLSVDYLNEKYPLSLQENEEYETLAGYILYFNESIPSEGEKIEVHGILFEILRVKNARIEEIKVII
ncbi:hemolysin family protein, partial [Porphyromonadaceae bacterium OttesenSCG-928-L07]|nr:hemolysin family protein [Porphyromonadaceae bacterium OttesenSCG-928-L07]